MASILCPYISFTDTARDAMTLYHHVFGGELIIRTFGEFGNDDPAVADLVMHSQLETVAGYTIMASDTPPGMERTEGSSITVMVSGDDAETLRGYFTALSDGGTVTMPLEKQFWGDEFGMVTDRFGVAWGIDISAGEDVA